MPTRPRRRRATRPDVGRREPTSGAPRYERAAFAGAVGLRTCAGPLAQARCEVDGSHQAITSTGLHALTDEHDPNEIIPGSRITFSGVRAGFGEHTASWRVGVGGGTWL
jgi:hypothetical protein